MGTRPAGSKRTGRPNQRPGRRIFRPTGFASADVLGNAPSYAGFDQTDRTTPEILADARRIGSPPAAAGRAQPGNTPWVGLLGGTNRANGRALGYLDCSYRSVFIIILPQVQF